MRILNLNSNLHSISGNIPYRIHKILLKLGYDSFFVTVDTSIDEPEIIKYPLPFQNLRTKLVYYLGRILFGFKRSMKYVYYPEWNLFGIRAKRIRALIKENPDLIIAYWTDYYFTQKVIYELSKITGAPVLWYMMDMAPLTGGCHMSYDCRGYEKGCGKCPALRFGWKYDLSYRSYLKKAKYIAKTNISTVSASTFLYNQALNCNLYKDKMNYKIMLPVDERIYQPGCKERVREELDIPQYSKVILFGSASLNTPYKGIKYLLEALKILDGRFQDKPDFHTKILMLFAGNNNLHTEIPFPYKHVGYLKTSENMAKIYQAADVYVCPTIQDSGPVMINESIMCGTPVVSFAMGAAYDLVHTGQTGYRAKLKDSCDLANGIESILKLSAAEWQTMSNRCRQLGLKHCASAAQVNKMIEIGKGLPQMAVNEKLE
ncbi:MAG: glycosyltransferase [Eubacteriales bacterium]|nr:glycosyltransferase [Eubacteriales bacterium]